MSTYSDLPSSRPIQRGGGLFSSLAKAFKKVPILSTGASFLPGVGKLAAPLLAKKGLGRRRRRRVKRKPMQGGRINLRKLAKASLPYVKRGVKKAGLVNKLVGKIPLGGPLLQSLAKSQGYGKRRRRRRPKRTNRRR
jgi:hypothetical protein